MKANLAKPVIALRPMNRYRRCRGRPHCGKVFSPSISNRAPNANHPRHRWEIKGDAPIFQSAYDFPEEKLGVRSVFWGFSRVGKAKRTKDAKLLKLLHQYFTNPLYHFRPRPDKPTLLNESRRPSASCCTGWMCWFSLLIWMNRLVELANQGKTQRIKVRKNRMNRNRVQLRAGRY
jgi:hypothetical protein